MSETAILNKTKLKRNRQDIVVKDYKRRRKRFLTDMLVTTYNLSDNEYDKIRTLSFKCKMRKYGTINQDSNSESPRYDQDGTRTRNNKIASSLAYIKYKEFDGKNSHQECKYKDHI